MPKINEVKSELTINIKPNHLCIHEPVAISLGPILEGACLPHPDLRDTDTAVSGVCHRFARKPPQPDRIMMDKLAVFVKKWLEDNLIKLPVETDVSFETWIEDTPYTKARKDDLKKKRIPIEEVLSNKRYWKAKSFVKDEFYVEFKHARAINSRSDEFKCAVGPWFKCIERVLFKKPEFIKKIPVSERPKYIMDKLYRNGAKYVVTDYTSFEALFTKDLMEKVEFQLYKYMTSEIPGHVEFWKCLDEVLAGANECQFKNFNANVKATRMSGEMCTSLGNGFSNLMFMLFMCEQKGCKAEGIVEGDDGLFVVEGDVPTPLDFEKLGLRLKMDTVEELNKASFCGNVFDDTDMIMTWDPFKALALFGWGSRDYINSKRSVHLSLLRSKSLSLVHQFPNCPVIDSLARYGLRMTKHIDNRVLFKYAKNTYERERINVFYKTNIPERKEIPMKTRLLVESFFGFSISEQLRMENYLDNKSDLLPIKLLIDVQASWCHYFSNYCHVRSHTDLFTGVLVDHDRSYIWKASFKIT